MTTTTGRRRLTFADLVRAEPRLAELLADARAVRDTGGASFCRSRAWRESNLALRLLPLVGFECAVDELRNSWSFACARKALLNALPPCRGCCSCNQRER